MPYRMIVAFILALTGSLARADAPRALPADKLPDDARLGAMRTLDSYFPMTPPASAEAWKLRKERLQRQTLVALGLWPMPTKTPLNPVVHGKVERDDYTVERVILESYPGHYVTGSLYRPKKTAAKMPGVLCPHGHWSNGRFYDAGERGVRNEIASGAERFEVSGRYPLQARCVQLARMGCVVFHYDMEGYADSVQFEHRAGPRGHMSGKDGWGLFSPQAEARLQTSMGLQTWNSIRAMDFLLSLEGVDPDRIAVTGASGGGTQTFLLAGVDDRVTVSVPAVMVSTSMQGGCTCENTSYLRVGTGNIELAGLFAPKPQWLIAADDWTKELGTKGLPELKQLYTVLGAPNNIGATLRLDFPHNYNAVNRTAMYNWINRHFKLGFDEPVIERDFTPLTREESTVWTGDHPAPTGEAVRDAHEMKLTRWMTHDSDKQLQALIPRDEPSLAEYRRVIGGAVEVMIGRRYDEVGEIEHELKAKQDRGAYLLMTGLLHVKAHGEQLPTLYLYPKQWNGQVVIWAHEDGKAALLRDNGGTSVPADAVQRLLDAGYTVMGLDLLYQGEFTADGKSPDKARSVRDGQSGWQAAACYTHGYNHPLFSQRVHDILSAVSFVRNDKEHPTKAVHVVGLGGAGAWAAAAGAMAGEAIDKRVVATGGFRFADLTAYSDANFLPGGAKYLDLPGILALNAPHAMWLAGEGDKPAVTGNAYRAAGKTNALTVFSGPAENAAHAAAEWLTTK